MLRPWRLPMLLLPFLLLACLCGPLSCESQQHQPPPCVQPRIDGPLLARHQGGSLILTDVCLDGYAMSIWCCSFVHLQIATHASLPPATRNVCTHAYARCMPVHNVHA